MHSDVLSGGLQEAVREAARHANALGFIDELPDKMQTVVGEWGSRLSGGQVRSDTDWVHARGCSC